MPRYLLLHLPAFRLERCGWTADQLVILADEEKNALRVQARTPAARSAGVRPGMTVAEARAICPALEVELRRADEELRDLHDLSGQLLAISPNIAALPPESLVAEVGRSARLFSEGGQDPEAHMLARMCVRLRELGHVVNGVVADDPATALACAAWGEESRVVPPGGGAAALAPLPLAALHLPWAEHDLLIGLGIRSVGDFAALPPASLAGRFGPATRLAHALARGRALTPTLPAAEVPELVSLRQDLPDPIDSSEALLFVVNSLLIDASARLCARAQAATRLTLLLRLDGAPTQQLSLRLGAPTRAPARILRLLRLQLERFALAAPVVSVEVELTNTVDFDGRQSSLLGRHRVSEALSDVVARLQDALGSAAVAVPMLADRHLPEGAWEPRPLDPVALPEPARSPGTAVPCTTLDIRSPSVQEGLRSDPAAEWEGWPAPPVPRRPSLLLAAARPLDVRAGRWGLPAALHVDGRWLDVVGLDGPERRLGEWWADSDFSREYWRAALSDGREAWLYREVGHWLLHGWWDGGAAR